MTSTFQDVSSKNEDFKLISVSEAIRKHFGRYKVKGTIIGISKLFNMIFKVSFYCDYCTKLTEIGFVPPEFSDKNIDRKCDICKRYTKNGLNPEYKNAVLIELHDNDTFNDMDRLSVFLFDSNTERIRVGETVTITGDIHILNNKKLFAYLYGESIEYLNREDLILTKLDIEAIKRFARINKMNIIDTLVSMFDPSIVGYEHVKKGLLMCAVNTSDDISKNERLNSLLIGDPGLGKTKLAKRVTKLVPNSRYESGQSSSGKSLTAIIEKTDENTFLRLGPIPLAGGAICTINELGRQSLEDQGHLLDIMEEGEFTKNAFGKNVRIRAPTAIIATSNPINNSKWRDNDKIDLNEFPILEPIVDRFDLIFPFKGRKVLKEIRNFAEKLADIEDKKDKGTLPDYTLFLIKYIQYARKLQPRLTEEARTMLREFYIEISSKNFGSPRVMITLTKIAKAIARLKLKEIADEYDAKEAMEFYNIMLVDFQKSVVVSKSPREIAYRECITMLKDLKALGGITLGELFEKLCEKNQQLAAYFKYSKKPLKIEDNKKIRAVYGMLLNHSNIKMIQEKPVVLRWMPLMNKDDIKQSDLTDPTDLTDSIHTQDQNNEVSKSDLCDSDNISVQHSTGIENKDYYCNNTYPKLRSDMSVRSDISSSLSSQQQSYKCYRCPKDFPTKEEYTMHCHNNHPKEPMYPNLSLIKILKLQERGNPWE